MSGHFPHKHHREESNWAKLKARLNKIKNRITGDTANQQPKPSYMRQKNSTPSSNGSHADNLASHSANTNSDIPVSTSTATNNSNDFETSYQLMLDMKRIEFEERYKSCMPSLNSSLFPVSTKVTSSPVGFIKIESSASTTTPLTQANVKLDDFDLDRTVGTGTYGRVMIAYLKRDRSQRYAVKIQKKEFIFARRRMEQAIYEKKILHSINFPFIVNLAYSFKDNSNLYMVLEYVSGGEMFTHLRKTGRYSEEVACFYASQIVLAVEYLHHLDIVYRDLKQVDTFFTRRKIYFTFYRPENVLFDSSGYIKITDFGFAKIIKGRTWTLCGTPEYMAPEIILSRGFGKPADWWALGVLVYEMVAGFSPFSGENSLEIFEKITLENLRFQAHFSADLKSLLNSLIQADLTKRIGNLRYGVNEIKKHRWFNRINWKAVYEKRIKAPYLPKEEFEHCDEERLIISATEKFAEEFAEF